MTIRVITGGDAWASINLGDEQEAINTASQCYAYARERWPNERTRIEGVSEEQLKLIKKLARAQ